MGANLYLKEINDCKKCMRVFECAHYVFINEIETFDFKKISKYNKSKKIYEKISSDFKVVNQLINSDDLFNAATVLRTLYENIIYIIATSYDKKLKIRLNMTPGLFRKVLEDNCNHLFTDFFDKEDFNYIYKYLCKITHPCSMKELLSYLSNTIKYKKHLLINLKYTMILIEYMFLNYLRKRLKMDESQFDLNFTDYCTYVNLINISLLLSNIKNGMNIVKQYMIYDINNKYIEDNKKICDELSKLLKENDKEIVKNIAELTEELDNQINESKYKEVIDRILKGQECY